MDELRASAAAVISVLLVGVVTVLVLDAQPGAVTDVLLALAFMGTVLLATLLVR
jgi:hypothetical protein